MKHFLTIVLVGLIAMPLLADDPDVAIVIGDPGYYGRLDDIDYYGKPKLIYAQPVIVERVASPGGAMYLHVPPGHYKEWKKNCRRYNSCGRQVYFVDHDWYEHTFIPAYHKKHPGKHKGEPKHNGNDNGQGKRKGHDKD